MQDVLESSEELCEFGRRTSACGAVPGVQSKVQAVFDPGIARFRPVASGGSFLLKPQTALYAELPENEDLTMGLARICEIEVPAHGLVYAGDGRLVYAVRRFDRRAGAKRMQEDFAQLGELYSCDKYHSSVEKLVSTVRKFCTDHELELKRLFRRLLFSYLTGNADMHLKNYSVIMDAERVALSPAYDLVNTVLAVPADSEESALPLAGRKRKLTRRHLVSYLGEERIGLSHGEAEAAVADLTFHYEEMRSFVSKSFLSKQSQAAYLDVLERRVEVLQ
jgi:serine/threonine-protein kinase HipA